MKKNTLKLALLIATLARAAAFAPIVSAAPPTPVAEMSKKELKTYKRDTKEYSFDTQVMKDRSSGITWLQSPVVSDPSTPSMSHYIRTAFKDGKAVATQIIVSHTHTGFNEYDRNTMDYTSIKLDGVALPTEVGDPLRDPGNDTITQISSVMIPESILKSHADSGLDLKAVNTFGETDVPIKPALVGAFLSRLERLKEKGK